LSATASDLSRQARPEYTRAVSSRAESPDLARIPSLDGVRGIAILLVLFHHAQQHWPWPPLLHPLAEAGWSGVDLFFALSGFLITGILLRGRGAPRGLAKFWVRRALRIFPPAYATIGLCYWLSTQGAEGFAPQSTETWTWFLLYGGNLYVVAHGWPSIETLAVMWSLAIEEQFYFVWPLVTRWAPRVVIALVAVALVVIGPMFRAWLWPEHRTMSAMSTLGRCDALAMGALLAMAIERPTLRAWIGRFASLLAVPATLATIWMCSLPMEDPEWLSVYRHSLTALGYTTLVAAGAVPSGWLGRWLRVRWLRWLGERSYGIYLLHFMVRPLYARWTDPLLDRGMASSIGWMLTVCACAALSFRLFEKPILGLRDPIERALGLASRPRAS
jgi:peptidoglycan/LPS O-acetylase OafA/YrhL